MSKRTESPGHDGWARTIRPDDPDKYFVVSADRHANEPRDWVESRLDSAFLDRLPRLEEIDGESFIVTEGARPWKTRTDTTDWGPEDIERNKTGNTVE